MEPQKTEARGSPPRESYLKRFSKLLRRPNVYDLMIVTLIILAISGAAFVGPTILNFGLPQLLVALLTAAALDFVIKYFRYKTHEIPKSAIIIGLFIGTLIAASAPLEVAALAAAIAIASKHIFRRKGRTIFNPTAFGLVAVFFLFGIGQAWWAASFWQLVIPLGLLVAYNFKRYGLVATFLVTTFALELGGAAFGLSFVTTFNVINNPLNPLLYFFAFLMVVEPKSSPASAKGRLIYGAVAAVAVFAANIYSPAIAPLGGLLIANAFSQPINWAVTRQRAVV